MHAIGVSPPAGSRPSAPPGIGLSASAFGNVIVASMCRIVPSSPADLLRSASSRGGSAVVAQAERHPGPHRRLDRRCGLRLCSANGFSQKTCFPPAPPRSPAPHAASAASPGRRRPPPGRPAPPRNRGASAARASAQRRHSPRCVREVAGDDGSGRWSLDRLDQGLPPPAKPICAAESYMCSGRASFGRSATAAGSLTVGNDRTVNSRTVARPARAARPEPSIWSAATRTRVRRHRLGHGKPELVAHQVGPCTSDTSCRTRAAGHPLAAHPAVARQHQPLRRNHLQCRPHHVRHFPRRLHCSVWWSMARCRPSSP